MWPWEHLAVGYLLYSVAVRGSIGRAPAAGGALALALGTQFPDLVDKPLGWGTELLPAGQSLGHSLLFAIPVVTAALAAAIIVGRTALGAAFAVGYGSHLPGDAVYPVLLGGDLNLSFLLWPALPAGGSDPVSVLSHVQQLFADFAATLATPAGAMYLLFELALVGGALAVWIVDGAPGLPRPSRNRRSELS